MRSVLLCQYDVLVLTETWLDECVGSAELGLNDFDIYRKDRSGQTSLKSRGGGVLVGVRRSMCSQEIIIDCTNIEQLFVKIRIEHNVIIVGGIYIPPNSHVNVYENHCTTVDSVFNLFPQASLLLWSDYNLPYIKWDNFGVNTFEAGCGGPTERTLCNSFTFHDLRQLNKIENCNSRILDLFWSNVHLSRVSLADDVLLPVDRHHPALCAAVPVHARGNVLQYDTTFYNFRKGDLIGLNNYLSGVDWDGVLGWDHAAGIDVLLDRFYDVLASGIEQFIPVSRLRSPKFPRWYTGELKNLIFEKKKAHKKYKNSNDFYDYLTFSSLRERCKIVSKNCYQHYVQNTESSIPSNIKSFWNFVSDKLNLTGLPQSMRLGDDVGSSGTEIARLFSQYFRSVYRLDVKDKVPATIPNNNINVNYCTVDLQTVYTYLCSLNINKGPGPDGVPPLLLNACRCSLARPLWRLFSLSLDTGTFPDRWKKSYITPIHKSGDKSNILNYRPVSILSTMPKLFENIIADQIKSTINSTLIQQQHGFSIGKSTTTNMMCFTQYVLSALEEHSQVDAVYTDFSKAFDTVNIRLLCAKLHAFGFGGILMKWMECYLTGRTQSVRLKDAVSDEFVVTSGVPQGSHLGPFLFNIFINDIEVYLKCPFLLFADDCKMFRVIKSVSDCCSLQSDLECFEEWCRINCLDLNVEKCQVMSFHRCQKKINFSYRLSGQCLVSVERAKDLGMILDPRLDFHFHFHYIITKALKILGFICRVGRNFSNIFTLKLLYQTLVRPILEYSSPVWSPTYQSHVLSLEMVQNKFLKFVSMKLNIDSREYSATAMRSVMGLPRLSDRRVCADLVFLHGLVNSIVNCPVLMAQIGILVPQRNTRIHFTFSQPFHRYNYGLHSPIARLLSEGNVADFDIFNVSRAELTRRGRRV